MAGELTVPVAPTRVGETAAILQPITSTASTYAKLGDVVHNVAMKIENDRLDRQMGRAQVDVEKDLGELRNEMEALGDPDEIDQVYAARVDEIRQRYLNGTNDKGRRLVDKRNEERFGLAFDSVANRHGLALGTKTVALRQSEKAATFANYDAVAANEAARTSGEGRDEIYQNYDAYVDKLVDDGIKNPEQGAALKLDFRSRTESAEAIGLIQSDPEGYLELAEAGAFNNLDPETLARNTNSARTQIAERDRAEATAVDKREREENAAWKKDLDGAVAAAAAGRYSPAIELLGNPEVLRRLPEEAAQLEAALALSGEGKNIGTMTPAELTAALEEEKKAPASRKWQLERQDLIEQTLKADKAGWARDPISYAREKGLPGFDVELPEFDPANPETFGEVLEQRVRLASELVEKGYVAKAPLPLTTDEIAGLKAMTVATEDPEMRAALAGTLATSIGPDGMAKLGLDQSFVFAGGLASEGRAGPKLLGEVMKGQTKLASKLVELPPLKERHEAIFDQVGSLFEGVPGGDGALAGVVSTADALYAQRTATQGPLDDIDEAVYKQALHEALGGTGTWDDTGSATGGVADIRGKTTFMPAGIPHDMAESALDNLSYEVGRSEKNGGFRDPDAPARAGERVLETFETMSLTGGVPQYGERALSGDEWEAAEIVAVGDDEYLIGYRSSDGTLRTATDSTSGQAFRFSMRRLIEAMQ